MNFLEKLRGALASKTANAALFVALVGVAEQAAPGIITAIVPPGYSGLAVSCLGVVFWVLRWVTTKPLEAK